MADLASNAQEFLDEVVLPPTASARVTLCTVRVVKHLVASDVFTLVLTNLLGFRGRGRRHLSLGSHMRDVRFIDGD